MSIKDRLKITSHLDEATIKTIESYMGTKSLDPVMVEEELTATLRPVQKQEEASVELPDKRKETLVDFLKSKGYSPEEIEAMDYRTEMVPLANKLANPSLV